MMDAHQFDGWTRVLAGASRRKTIMVLATRGELGRAAAWCAQDRETDVEIARRLGIGRRTLARWKHRPEFRAALAALQERQASDAKPLESDATER